MRKLNSSSCRSAALIWIGSSVGSFGAPAASEPATTIAKPVELSHYTEEMYRHALKNNSTSPDYLLATIQLGSEAPRRICVNAKFLLGAIHTENNLPYDDKGVGKAMEMALKPGHSFVFTKPKAIDNVRPDYSEADLDSVRRALSEVPLAAFKNQSGESVGTPRSFSHVVLERGLMVTASGCYFSGPRPYALSERIEEERNFLERRKAELRRAATMAAALDGWTLIKKDFLVEKEPFVGCVGMEPISLTVDLVPLTPSLIDSASWWNTLKDDRPVYTWADFRSYFEGANKILSRQRWLVDFKKLPGSRSVDVRLYGVGVADSSPALKEVVELWRHAGLSGMPYGQAFARCGKGCTSLYFGKEDDRLLVAYSWIEGRSPLCPIDRLEVSWSGVSKPGSPESRYAIIHPDGTIEERHYPEK